MIKEIRKSKYFSWSLDAIGLISLVSFVVLSFFNSFIVDVLSNCYWTSVLIGYVECGNSFFGEILKLYFILFSLSSFIYFPFLIFGLFHALVSLQLKSFLLSLLFLFLWIIALGASFHIVSKIIKGFRSREEYNSAKRHKSLLYLLIIFIPVFSILALKYYMKPPEFSKRIITVDMWHEELSFPRHYLEDWSLIDIQRPEKKPAGTPGASIHLERKVYPFVDLNIGYNEIYPSINSNDKIEIRLVPNYSVLSEEILYQMREDYLQDRVQKMYTHSDEKPKVSYPVYGTAERKKDWEVYRSSPNAPSHMPDIYVHRNNNGGIENIVRCTPKRRCLERAEDGYKVCKRGNACQACSSVCSDESFGNMKYVIDYSFDKKDLDSYFDRHQKIINFIDAHGQSKNSSRTNN